MGRGSHNGNRDDRADQRHAEKGRRKSYTSMAKRAVNHTIRCTHSYSPLLVRYFDNSQPSVTIQARLQRIVERSKSSDERSTGAVLWYEG
jgi:hypothetical protein